MSARREGRAIDDSPRKNPKLVITPTIGMSASAPGSMAGIKHRVRIMPPAAMAQARCLSIRFITCSQKGMPAAMASVMGMAR